MNCPLKRRQLLWQIKWFFWVYLHFIHSRSIRHEYSLNLRLFTFTGALGFQAITYSKSNPRELRSDLPVLLKISEIGGSIGGETLASINANLQSTGSTILLPHPILIRPGFPYIITISEFPNEYFGYFKDFQKVVKIGTDTEISFLDDKCDDKGNVYGFISTLDFNCI